LEKNADNPAKVRELAKELQQLDGKIFESLQVVDQVLSGENYQFG